MKIHKPALFLSTFGFILLVWVFYGLFHTPAYYPVWTAIILVPTVFFCCFYTSYRMNKNYWKDEENDFLRDLTVEEKINYFRGKRLKETLNKWDLKNLITWKKLV